MISCIGYFMKTMFDYLNHSRYHFFAVAPTKELSGRLSLGEVELLQTCEAQGLVLITCQFCDQQYQFSENAIKAMFNTKPNILH